MVTLLDKTRRINKLLQRSENVEYDSISKVLSNLLNANIYIMDTAGEIRGYADDFMREFSADFVQMINLADSTKVNFDNQNTTLVPIYGVGKRIGTLIIARHQKKFSDDDLIVAEYGATVVGMELIREHTEKLEIIARKKANVQIALATLSYSEAEAAVNILGALNGNEGLLVASKIADRVGITRSVIVNALRKFESAGVIESKSLGMKGTYIKILNEYLLDEVQKLRR